MPGVFVHQGLKPNSPELKRLYGEADIFCLPTHGDCLPMALAEAGAVGLPIVSTRVAAIPEIVQEGVNGFLVQPRDTAGLALALDRLAGSESLRKEMGAQSYQIVTRDHNVERNAERLMQVICGAVKDARQERPPARQGGPHAR
jgi:glycosyltransferase involved in cell wall biosynthesis